MFKELSAPDMVEALKLTNTMVIVDETKQSNLDYLNELARRSSTDTKKEQSQLVGGKVKEVRVNFDRIMNYLDAVTSAIENKTLGTLYAELEGIIEKANAIVKAWYSRKNNEGE